MSQWASALAEKGFGFSKTVGDLAVPLSFAALMGCSRAFYGKFGDKINLERFMQWSAALCIVSYLMIAFIPIPALGFLGCALCGLSVGIMWPGTFSMASAAMKRGGTALFALLALAGDLGCSSGPTYVGMISSRFHDNLKTCIFRSSGISGSADRGSGNDLEIKKESIKVKRTLECMAICSRVFSI